jgi:hypothetical protein
MQAEEEMNFPLASGDFCHASWNDLGSRYVGVFGLVLEAERDSFINYRNWG